VTFGAQIGRKVQIYNTVAIQYPWLLRVGDYSAIGESAIMAWLGGAVSVAIVLMKVVPSVPGSFTRAEWMAFAAWSAFGLLFWLARPRTAINSHVSGLNSQAE